MKNYKITVSYDGTRYKGWQVLKSTDATIQGKLQMVLSALAGHPGPGRDRPRPHLGGETAVELFVERYTGRRVQCCRQMDHKKPLLFGQCAKLDP